MVIEHGDRLELSERDFQHLYNMQEESPAPNKKLMVAENMLCQNVHDTSRLARQVAFTTVAIQNHY